MAFGSGVLVATLTFSILIEAFSVTHTLPATVTGFILGGISFSFADYFLKRKSASKSYVDKQDHVSSDKERSNGQSQSGQSLFIGAIMDMVPENAALGITLAMGGALNVAFLAAIFISNLPEGLASTNGLKDNGLSRKRIFALWSIALVIGTLSTIIGYTVLSYASPPIISISIAFAAGAILVMLADSIIPEAFKEAGMLKGNCIIGRFSNCSHTDKGAGLIRQIELL
jgi:zinc transporter, ZIP family